MSFIEKIRKSVFHALLEANATHIGLRRGTALPAAAVVIAMGLLGAGVARQRQKSAGYAILLNWCRVFRNYENPQRWTSQVTLTPRRGHADCTGPRNGRLDPPEAVFGSVAFFVWRFLCCRLSKK